ncbi:hypothetical protein F751_6333 [Auxenochlorella protothecoides]|uniref:ShKT domain-containing protein n=1 Tax=Auxenochlorella protothecoides TaxID=3075 RepID=A0A087SSV8_AUXPR|nr:hypothetical protein F751_6333 [Auxenochlorella protothecoides]KFM28812.1 hypothetical protein F751_6333 [Auxenochlorella protothecoides]
MERLVAHEELEPNRVSNCTDVAPDTSFTCEEQAQQFDKCNADFIYLYSFCLKSCGRCGGET